MVPRTASQVLAKLSSSDQQQDQASCLAMPSALLRAEAPGQSEAARSQPAVSTCQQPPIGNAQDGKKCPTRAPSVPDPFLLNVPNGLVSVQHLQDDVPFQVLQGAQIHFLGHSLCVGHGTAVAAAAVVTKFMPLAASSPCLRCAGPVRVSRRLTVSCPLGPVPSHHRR